MKRIQNVMHVASLKKMSFALMGFLTVIGLSAQTGSLRGEVKDGNGEALYGATVSLEGTTKGAFTTEQGTFSINNIDPGSYTVRCSFIGYTTIKKEVVISSGQESSVNFTLRSDALLLDEAIVIGYGTTKKEDLTGSTTVVSSEDFTTGNVTTPEQLVTGKISGVQITSNDGAPGSGSRIRIRGGTSLNASNDPLIVLDGVPLDNNGIDGSANALNLINPNDIENVVVLKDASAAAIYGSRGANGVILITTKKGDAVSNKLKVDLSHALSFATVPKYADALTSTEFRDVVNEYGSEQQIALLGNASTDWQKEIYRTALINETNVSLTGGIKNLPYRFSVSRKNEEGVLKRHELTRSTFALNLSPSILDDHFTFDVNAKYSITDNFFANQDAIGAAVSFDPTQPVTTDSEDYGGYFEWLNPFTGLPNNLAGKNPLGLLMQKDDYSDVIRFIGNAKVDYQTHFLPDLHLVANVGGDFSESEGRVRIGADAASNFFQGGELSQFKQSKVNRLLETYLNYSREFDKINSDVDFTAGYSYQYWRRNTGAFPLRNIAGDTITPAGIPGYNDNTLISQYGRLKYVYNDKYLLTATVRRDGSSRFNPDERWGIFPSFAAAWRISEENFLKDRDGLSYLKLRAGYGVTGQQDIGNDYPYLANYQTSTSTAQYQFGDQFYTLLRPDGFDYNIKWEETTSLNGGLDFGFFRDRISGSLDIYKKETDDLLAIVDVPAGVNFTNEILTNVGAMENTGVELELHFVTIAKKETDLTLGINASMNRNEITRISQVMDSTTVGILTGGIGGGIGNNIQIHAVGHPLNSYYVYEQILDSEGLPVDTTDLLQRFVDRNGDGVINDEDRYIMEKPAPDVYAGFYANFRHKRVTAGFSLRGEFGRYVYNNNNSQRGNFASVPLSDYLVNLNSNFLESELTSNPTEQFLSDYYVEKANFLRMDYFNIGYDLSHFLDRKNSFFVNLSVNNVFVVSDYSGLDPEVASGIDNNIYPRPRIYSVRVNLNF
jgi:TonB-linked SusC/RagA family outer membrane protein